MNRTITARLVMAASLALLLTGCGGKESVTSAVSSAEKTIKAKDKLRFEPNTLDAKVGQTVTVLIENVSRSDHSFIIDALHVDTGSIAGGQQGVVSFVVERPGKYTFYSGQPGDRTGGMVGLLTVTE